MEKVKPGSDRRRSGEGQANTASPSFLLADKEINCRTAGEHGKTGAEYALQWRRGIFVYPKAQRGRKRPHRAHSGVLCSPLCGQEQGRERTPGTMAADFGLREIQTNNSKYI